MEKIFFIGFLLIALTKQTILANYCKANNTIYEAFDTKLCYETCPTFAPIFDEPKNFCLNQRNYELLNFDYCNTEYQ